MSAPAEPRPVHTFSPPARPPYRSASAGHMPPRPRPSTRPTRQPASHFRSPDVSPDKPPGHYSSEPKAGPASLCPPPSKSQAEDPLLRAAEMFSNPASGPDSSKPAAPSGASVARDNGTQDATKTSALPRLSEASCCSSGHFS